MKKINKLLKVTATLFFAFFSNVIIAGSIATEQVDARGLTLIPASSFYMATLRISGNKNDLSGDFSEGEVIRFDASRMPDGVYSYELSLILSWPDTTTGSKTATQYGRFRVASGITTILSNNTKYKVIKQAKPVTTASRKTRIKKTSHQQEYY